MAITGYELHWTGSTGSAQREPLSEQYTTVWRVFSDDPQDQARTVLVWFVTNVDNLGSVYSYAGDSAGFARLNRLRAKRVGDSRLVWEVTGEYATVEDEESEDNNGNPTDDPTQFRPRIWTTTAQYTQPVVEAYYHGGYHGTAHAKLGPPGNLTAVCNSALQPFVPPPERDESRFLIHVQRNFFDFDADLAEAWLNNLNSSPLTIIWFNQSGGRFIKTIERWQARVREYTGQLRRQNAVDFWEHTLTLDIRQPNWLDRLLDRGLHGRRLAGDPDGHGGIVSARRSVLVGAPKIERFKGPDGTPTAEPVLLDGDGQPLDLEADPLEPVWSTWRYYIEDEFRVLPPLAGLIGA